MGTAANTGHHGTVKLSLDDARDRAIAQLAPIDGTQRVAVRQALNRVLGEDILSSLNVPAHTNSAMDGYALRGVDLPTTGEVTLHVIGDAFAGHLFAGEVSAGECVRIMTGGVLPRGADTVVIQEDVSLTDARVRIGAGHTAGQNVRKAGEDLAVGARVLAKGRRLTAADLGLIASVGMAEVTVQRALRVAFFSTGDELRSLGEPLGAGQIYDSNRYTLYGMLTRCGADVFDLGVVRDDPDLLRDALERAGATADVVITTGGVSVGAADHVREVLAEVGEIGFWKVNIKPGMPLAFGRLRNGAAFFGLPGNPVSTMVTFYEVIQPILDYLSSASPRPPLVLWARTSVPLRKSHHRREFQRGYLESGAEEGLRVRPASPQGSGILRSMSLANCFIVLPEDSGPVAAGEKVRVEPFAGLI